ncbi:sirohydrochlorin chelatase [Saliterribacillus persicus]|uniref:Sirohydrochlorin ferrochelatase n=1 Tax=Saliterribacillus persicus TaxID=930114 RepID=A0A368XV99_9BACI|nr:sirohydrochlorin chelatase [Saliterribacillus persicus]RCW71882.1 sirohydrochlorin ferrochelatase [Saliterribacillus persicus]
MDAVLYICHGSRRKEAKIEANACLKKTMAKLTTRIQEVCFLELEEPNISEGIRVCVEKGATNIAIVPILLLTAGHAKIDIPEVLEREKKKYPLIKFNYGRPLGVENKMIEAVSDRVLDVTSNPSAYDILLVGRGSSDNEALEDTRKIKELLKIKLKTNNITACFLAASNPKFEELVTEKAKHHNKPILIIPYLLFTGLLIKEVHQTMEHLQKQYGTTIKVADYLGHHDNVSTLFKERVLELQGEWSEDAKMA